MGEGATAMSTTDEYGTDFRGSDPDEPVNVPSDAAVDTGGNIEVTEIRHSIEQTRSDLSETIDELQERLSPSNLKEQVKEQVMEQYRQARDSVREATIGKVEDMVERVGDTMYEARRGVVDAVTANPIPSAMAAIGLAWLWMNRADSPRSRFRYGSYGRRQRYAEDGPYAAEGEGVGDGYASRYIDQTGHLASKAKEAVSNVAGQVQGSASDLAGKAKDTVSGVVNQAQQATGYVFDQAQSQARRVEQRFNSAMEQSPLAVGAVALALGTAVGLAVPTTRKENEWMGEARDTVVEKAQSLASDAIDKVQEAVGTSTDQVASARAERQGDQPTGSF